MSEHAFVRALEGDDLCAICRRSEDEPEHGQTENDELRASSLPLDVIEALARHGRR